jgi:hypothetical protein
MMTSIFQTSNVQGDEKLEELVATVVVFIDVLW